MTLEVSELDKSLVLDPAAEAVLHPNVATVIQRQRVQDNVQQLSVGVQFLLWCGPQQLFVTHPEDPSFGSKSTHQETHTFPQETRTFPQETQRNSQETYIFHKETP